MCIQTCVTRQNTVDPTVNESNIRYTKNVFETITMISQENKF